MKKRRRTKRLIHKLPQTISGKSKKSRISPILAGVLVATCIYTFFSVVNKQNSNNIQNERQKMVIDEYHYQQSLERPTPIPNTNPTDFHMKVPIIMYHYVEYVKDPRDTIRKSLNIDPDVFQYQLQTLESNGFKTFYVKELAEALDGFRIMPKKSVILTFDDGYEDFYTYVLPILKKYKVKATLYVINDLVGSKGYISQKELDEIASSGFVEVGAHTLDHDYLKGMSKEAQMQQIIKSKDELESMLGIQIKTFAYPFGAFDDNSINIVKEASFSAAVSVIPGNDHSEEDRYYLYRIRAGSILGGNMIQNLEKEYEK